MAKLKVAQLQTKVYAEKKQTIEMLSSYLETLSPENVDLITLPEMFACPYQTSNFPIYAEREGDGLWQTCSELAKQHRVYLSAGSMPEVDEAGKVFNTAYVFDREGKQIAKHRKAHLFDINIQDGQHFKESDTLASGNHVTVFDTEFCKMGICICYDFRFPEIARLMVTKGAKIILVPAAFNMTTGPAHWELMFRSRAVDNQAYTLGTAPARDSSSEYISWGHSIAVGPWGNVIGELEEGEGYMIHELDLDVVDQVRAQLPLLHHRRTDMYVLEEVRK
ncbi:carbon-nitrogen hydrolase family protein [Desulfosporosinus acidiphilus]|nr:carbon-nitrogen hydrolase family protein [Desulfosporosinus acidiphilus]